MKPRGRLIALTPEAEAALERGRVLLTKPGERVPFAKGALEEMLLLAVKVLAKRQERRQG